jgi:hypothetical protein
MLVPEAQLQFLELGLNAWIDFPSSQSAPFSLLTPSFFHIKKLGKHVRKAKRIEAKHGMY